MKARIVSLIITLPLLFGFVLLYAPKSGASTIPPTIAAINLITNRLIEIDWAGTDYINGAGASKENPNAQHAQNFEIRLDGTALTQVVPPSFGNNTSGPWYWNIRSIILQGVSVTQNKTTLRLYRALSDAQLEAVAQGDSTLEVRIASTDVRASTLHLLSTPMGGIFPDYIGEPGASADTSVWHRVSYKPYYTETVLSQSGVPVRGSASVHRDTLKLAAEQIDVVTSVAPEPLLARLRETSQFLIFGPGEHPYNIPEHRAYFLSDNWNRTEGYGGANSSTSAAGVTRWHALTETERTAHGNHAYPAVYKSLYTHEAVSAHEMGHALMDAMNHASVSNHGSLTNMSAELNAIHRAVTTLPENPDDPDGRLRWQGEDKGKPTYMSASAHEFIATATAIWFDAMQESEWANNGRGRVNKRDELRQYCPQTYNFLTRVLPETRVLSEAWARDVPDKMQAFYPLAPPEPSGKYGKSVKLKSPSATNDAGMGLQTYIPFNAPAYTTPNVELWWDYDTDLMQWYLQPDLDSKFFRIARKNRPDYTGNPQRSDLVLMPKGGNTALGTEIVLEPRDSAQDSQWWKLDRQSDGTYVFTNKANLAAALVLRGDVLKSGTRIELGSPDAPFAKWTIEGDLCEICNTLSPYVCTCRVVITRTIVLETCGKCSGERTVMVTTMTTYMNNQAISTKERRAFSKIHLHLT
ncbi:MAG: RICIN domain-containing protein [Oscillospiraceae bacterium]|nr:RICIN domain-containing protein [Oscillospiraceae bacterium]